MNFYRLNHYTKRTLFWVTLIVYSFVVLYPILLMVMTSLKPTREIFLNPFGLPSSLYFDNYLTLLRTTRYDRYFFNSVMVIVVSLSCIITFAAHAAYIVARRSFPGKNVVYMLFIVGLILPIRLGTISLLQTMISYGFYDSIVSLMFVNVAFGIPFAVFILTEFIRMIPTELDNAARIDGCGDGRIFYVIIVPLLRPAIAAATLINLIPLWNDFWFPLVLIRTDAQKTVPLATALLFGQFQTNFGLVFAVLTAASVPVIVLYLLLSRQFVKSLTFGAIKG